MQNDSFPTSLMLIGHRRRGLNKETTVLYCDVTQASRSTTIYMVPKWTNMMSQFAFEIV